MSRHSLVMCSLLGLLACQASPTDKETGSVDTDPPDDTAAPGEPMSKCEFENPATPFTGGLYYLYSVAAPEGGSFKVTTKDNFQNVQSGTIDWEAGTISFDLDYIEDYTTLGASNVGTFTMQSWGDYETDWLSEVTSLDGSIRHFEEHTLKAGCSWMMSRVALEDGAGWFVHAILVSPDRQEYTVQSDPSMGDGTTYQASGVFTSDWTNTYTYETDYPDTTASPDLEGRFTNLASGETNAEIRVNYDDGHWQDHINYIGANGDWVDDWIGHDPAALADPNEWGQRRGDYWGAGSSWWYTDSGKGKPQYCESEWDTAGHGTWWCSDGGSGKF